MKELQEYATEHGLLGRNGKPLYLPTIQKMLKNPFYNGKMRRCEGLKPHIYPPLISQELWER